MSLVSEVWVQTRRRDALRDIEPRLTSPIVMTNDKKLQVVVEIADGATFADLARRVTLPIWPFAVDVRAALLRQRTTAETEELRD